MLLKFASIKRYDAGYTVHKNSFLQYFEMFYISNLMKAMLVFCKNRLDYVIHIILFFMESNYELTIYI